MSPDGRGEFAALGMSSEGLSAWRDPYGTRPLYTSRQGATIASDHRFFDTSEFVLNAPRDRVSVGQGIRSGAPNSPAPFSGSFDEAVETLAWLVEASVRSRVKRDGPVAVAFSGGLDSSLLALIAARVTRVVACNVSTKGSPESGASEKAARELGLGFLRVELTQEKFAQHSKAMSLPFATSSMDVALWTVYSIAAEAASNAGAGAMLLGQLADEVFGGYARYEKAVCDGRSREAIDMMESEVSGCAERGFIRDEAACSRWLEPRFPYAEQGVADFGRSLPLEFRVREGERKRVLRAAGLALGLPEWIAAAPKKAAQYSSGALKLVS